MPNTNSSPLISQPQSCPLAIDETGNPIPVPSDASYWRVRRHTGGRPHHVCGVDRKPLMLPLDYTADELLRLVGRGTYRLDLFNDAGEHLETVALTLGEPEPELRNQAAVVEESSMGLPMLPTTSSETRLVLEANVRATQMAFQHNEKTLTASLKMAETLRDGVQVLASSQAEWIKAMASARGFFRNAAPVVMQASALEANADTSHNDEDEPDEDDDELVYDSAPADKTGVVMSFGTEVMKFVNGMAGFGPSGKPVNLKKLAKQLGVNVGALLDWRKAAPTATWDSSEPARLVDGDVEASEASAPPATPLSIGEVLQVYASLPDDVRAKLDAVRGKLSPREQKQLMLVFSNNTPAQLRGLAIDLASGEIDETAAEIRKQLEPYSKTPAGNTVEKPAA
jgi:hypothetical protein